MLKTASPRNPKGEVSVARTVELVWFIHIDLPTSENTARGMSLRGFVDFFKPMLIGHRIGVEQS